MPSLDPVHGSGGGSNQNTNQSPVTPPAKHIVGAAVSGAIGGVFFLVSVVGGILWYKRKSSTQSKNATVAPFILGYPSSLLASGGPVLDNKRLAPIRSSADPLTIGKTPSGSKIGAISHFRSESTSRLQNEVDELRRTVVALTQNQVTAAPPTYFGGL